MAKEIERKFLLEKLPSDLNHIRKFLIKQGYICVSKHTEVRVRQKGWRYYLTVKSGSGLMREEFEIPLLRFQFNALWKCTKGNRLEKTRYIYELMGHDLEIDEYKGELKGLYTGEVEFNSPEDAAGYLISDFFKKEITYDPRYKNNSLSQIDEEKARLLKFSKSSQEIIGTIPFLIVDNMIKVVLVTNRKRTQWIFPKGQPETGKNEADVALMEAEEEAGIRGIIKGSPIRIPYEKGSDTINMLSFPIEVKKIHKNWLEEKERERRIVTIKEAYELSSQPAVHCGLKYLESLP